jgi:uncharacterized protein
LPVNLLLDISARRTLEPKGAEIINKTTARGVSAPGTRRGDLRYAAAGSMRAAAGRRFGVLGTRLSSGLALALIATAPACQHKSESSPVALTILTGSPAGSFYPVGRELARVYNDTVPGVQTSTFSTTGPVKVLEVQEGRADIAFTQADVAYMAYWRGNERNPSPHDRLRGMAVLWVNTVQVVVRTDSGIHRFEDLRGRRVAVGRKGSVTEDAARIVIEGHGMTFGDVKPEYRSFADLIPGVLHRTVDAGFMMASYPVSVIEDLNVRVGLRVLPITHDVANHIRSSYPYMRPVTIPANTYTNQVEDVATVGVDNVLVCRDDLSDELVYQLTKTLFQSLPMLARSNPAARLIDPDQGPITPIPLHRGAARYYRERELLK